jgi:heme-degrading monooxygenase HmoA
VATLKEVGMKEFASGRWLVTEGKQEEFLQRWTEFLKWTKADAPGLIEAHLLRDVEDARSFVSVSEWTDAASRDAWKHRDGFRSHLDSARSLCDEFSSSDYELATEVK